MRTSIYDSFFSCSSFFGPRPSLSTSSCCHVGLLQCDARPISKKSRLVIFKKKGTCSENVPIKYSSSYSPNPSLGTSFCYYIGFVTVLVTWYVVATFPQDLCMLVKKQTNKYTLKTYHKISCLFAEYRWERLW